MILVREGKAATSQICTRHFSFGKKDTNEGVAGVVRVWDEFALKTIGGGVLVADGAVAG